jgi:predicted O-linked N-acetylglucosamine transferase (SPINDLY family)
MERLHRLSRLPVYFYRSALPAAVPDRARLGLGATARLYVCPQSVFKLHPDFDAVAAEILRRDPKGELVLIEGTSRHWSRRWRERFAATAGDVSDRVRVVPRLSHGDFLGLLHVADALLDTFPFAGGTTSYNALGLGLPVVTWPGEFMRGRVTSACYRQLGVLDCVADSAEHYVQLALRLASDRSWRADLSARITAAQPELFEDVRAVREIEELFVAARSRAATPAGERG